MKKLLSVFLVSCLVFGGCSLFAKKATVPTTPTPAPGQTQEPPK